MLSNSTTKSRSFTSTYNGWSNELVNSVKIAEAFAANQQTQAVPQSQYKALWDTGATNSVITQKVVDECGLVATGIVDVHTAQGSHRTPTYWVSLFLPNLVIIPQLQVSLGLLPNTDLLIGMDVIGKGDFAVTNFRGLTQFSFRLPSIESIDFVRAFSNTSNPTAQAPGRPQKVKRNDLCPCGSGKKYKKCHGP